MPRGENRNPVFKSKYIFQIKKLLSDQYLFNKMKNYMHPKERNADIVYERFVNEKSYAEVGLMFGFTRQRIEQICSQFEMRFIELDCLIRHAE